LTVRTDSQPGGYAEVVCHRVMRKLDKTRTVYDALWQGRRIVLKVFTKFGKARYHALREWRGLRQLAARQVSAPGPLFFGYSPEGWAVATEWLDNAVTAMELWKTADTVDRKVQLLCLVARQLARQHDKGVTQSDMHLGNFMIRGEEVFALDPAMMRFRRGPIGRRRSILQIAQLTSMLHDDEDAAAIESTFREYAKARAWAIGREDVERVRTAHRRCRSRGIEWGLRKFLRTNRRHQAIRCGPWRGVADRKLSEAATLDEITAGLDEAMTRGQILKDGRTSFVSRVKLGGIEVVIKRYNHKGLLHSLRHTLKGSRAKRSWLNANRLLLLGIPTPRPLAYIDEYQGSLLRRCYFIAAFITGRELYGMLRDTSLPEGRRQRMIDEVVHTLDRMANHGISHGDLKHTNILCDGDTITLTDLDGMQVHRITWLQQRRHQRDLARFLRDVPAR
jgi:tRNA A-37 threonylcarbamoyl transferase component Bud32